MNKKMIVYILGKMMGVEGLLLLIPALVSLIYHEKSVISFLIVAAILLAIYMVFGRKLPASKQIYGKEGFVIVGLAWILWSAFGALPFVISGSIPHYIDALFETMDDENAMPLMRAEVPGPEADKLVPKARHTARILYGMYFVLTAAEVVFLLFGGMNLYDALLHAFSTAGTGGFSNRAASVSFYDSAYIDGVITVFMILFGINFNLYFFILLKDWKSIVGACAGSTGGGIKVSRLLIIVKSIRREVRKMLHPNAVTIIKVNGKKIGQDTLKNVNLYLTCYIMILIVSILLVSIDNFDFATTFSGVLTTMSNVGPGISKVGPVMNFHPFSALSKLVFCFDMLIGRLEIFPYLLLLSPELWRRRF